MLDKVQIRACFAEANESREMRERASKRMWAGIDPRRSSVDYNEDVVCMVRDNTVRYGDNLTNWKDKEGKQIEGVFVYLLTSFC